MDDLHVVAGPEHWEQRAEQIRFSDSLTEARLREIVREEIEWALRIARPPAAAPAPPKPKRQRPPNAGRKADLGRYRLMANRYEEGATALEVATEFGSCQATVRKAVRVCGVQIRPCTGRPKKERPDPRADEMRAMRERGATLEEIGAHFHITRERVRQVMVKAGVHIAERPLDPRQLEAARLYVDGASLDAAAAHLGVSNDSMRNVIVRAGHSIRPGIKQRSEETSRRVAETVRLYKEGKRGREIADAIGVAKPEMIYRYLALGGVIPSRGRGCGRGNTHLPATDKPIPQPEKV